MRPSTPAQLHSGFTLVEVMVIVAIIAVATAISAPAFGRMFANQRLRSSANDVSAAFSYARSEASRTGNVHLVFFQEDALGNTLPASSVLVVDDGRPGSANQNCEIDAGEPTKTFTLEDDVSFGLSAATAKAPNDDGAAAVSSGSTFEDASGNDATWVLFRPEGMPLAFDADCALGTVGSGGGGIYLTNGNRDYAVVLTPLGASHVHLWSGSAWSS